tara:strand:+ start:13426 stop:14124 length:699 start_codon:yes stop_codon:yes gene_type:complete
VQSIFGIGILFFGTPTLIILGLPFAETLATVLPASAAISLFQVWQGPCPQRDFIRRFGIWCLAPLAIVLVSGLYWGWDLELNLFVAGILLIYVVIRTSAAAAQFLKNLIDRFPKVLLSIIGTVHGLSNLGGGILAVFVSSLYEDKKQVRAHIAFCYIFFAAIQLAVLVILVPEVMGWHQLCLATLGGAVFLVTERCLFNSISSPLFDKMFTIIIGTYSVLIFVIYLWIMPVW